MFMSKHEEENHPKKRTRRRRTTTIFKLYGPRPASRGQKELAKALILNLLTCSLQGFLRIPAKKYFPACFFVRPRKVFQRTKSNQGRFYTLDFDNGILKVVKNSLPKILRNLGKTNI